MIAVANTTPQPSEMAMGTLNEVAGLSMSMSGAKPTTAVEEVNNIGLKRTMPARRTAATADTPRC